jgi:hypothetical protein
MKFSILVEARVMKQSKKLSRLGACSILALMVIFALPVVAQESDFTCSRTVKAQVVALDQPWMWNRLGAGQPGGIIYALYGDIVKSNGDELPDPWNLSPADREQLAKSLAGNVRLRDDKRARPLVLRANKGDCLEITFWNLLSTDTNTETTSARAFNLLARSSVQLANDKQTPLELKGASKGVSIKTGWAGIHATGIQLVHSIESDASWVGRNTNSLAAPGESRVYTWYAAEEGTFLLYSPADMEEAEQTQSGLFGAINVEPEGAEWYRSQVTHDDLEQATLTAADLKVNYRTLQLAPATQVTGKPRQAAPEGFENKLLVTQDPDKLSTVDVMVKKEGDPGQQRIYSADQQPLIYYHAIYDSNSKRPYRKGLPVLQMLQAKPLGKALLDEALLKSPSGYVQELRDLDAGVIPVLLRQKFKDHQIDLSAAARLTDEFHYSWLITDQGNAYLVKAVAPENLKDDPAAEWRLQIYDAELDLISSDLTALITGPDAGRFSYSNTSPTFRTNPASPDRRQPYREFTIIYHQAAFATQAFAQWANANLQNVMSAGGDGFAINYGSAAIGPEIVANRLGVGPMGNADAVDLKFEEFFLSSWAVGDPAMVVDVPANTPNEMVSNPNHHRQVRAQVPPGSPAAILASTTNNPARPAQQIPPQSDDFAPLTKVHATKAFFPDDPSNVYHSYMDDHVKFRILHAGAGPAHVHHLHAHQWLHSPDSDDGHYLDSQLIIPGSAYTLEITYGGSGNRNKTVGDSIFHCHFYPHFAEGMWALWRVHDVFEAGTLLDGNGIPKPGPNRVLPDGEIERGTPIPAIVPLPTLAMAPMPARVELTDLSPWYGEPIGQGRRVEVLPETEPGTNIVIKDPDGKPVFKNPGYPFFIPGVAGHRSPHPPLGFAWLEDPKTGNPVLDGDKKISLDGGLPRHLVLDGTITKEFQTRWDFTKDFVVLDKQGKLQAGGGLQAYRLPEEGTPVELAAMKQHATRTTPSSQPNGQPGNFTLNGLPPTPGAPYADPSVTDFGNANIHKRRYQAAVIQFDVVLNKKGWHFPQQRMVSLWQDVADTIGKKRPPEPLFFRSNTQDTIQFWHTNLVPNYYQLDDFQVRTPTDVIGQHIHLVKFDVTSSDGASNGFNYESGTFGPEEVREQIFAINEKGGLYGFDPGTGYVDKSSPQEKLVVKKVNDYYPKPDSTVITNGGVPVVSPAGDSVFGKPPNGEDWDGAQTTVELWAVDPLLNNQGEDRTLRTVFTHDHFSPSTHQQAGLYAGLVVEPEDSLWYLPNGDRMNTRSDGGPTSWHGYIVPKDPKDSYREFMLEFQDLQLAYNKGSRTEVSSSVFDPGSNPEKPLTSSAAFDLSQAHSIPELETKAFPAYVKLLNKEELPTGSEDQLAAGFPELFLQFGVPLSPKAKVKKIKENAWWTIKEAEGQINAGVTYIVRAFTDTVIQNGKTVPGFITHMLVYTPDVSPGWSDPKFALNPPSDTGNSNPYGFADGPPNGPPFPGLVSTGSAGTYSLNYRNDPVPLRLGGTAPTPEQSDLALVFSSIPRADTDLNAQPDPLDLVDAQPDDPFTPLLEAYANDKVQVRTLVGAHVQSHAFEIHGVNWLFEPTYQNSGYRNAQLMGLSEHFEMLFDLPPVTFEHSDLKSLPAFADYFYSPSSDIVGLNNGLWGIMRAYGKLLPDQHLHALPNNEHPASPGNIDLFEQGYAEAKQSAAAKKTGGAPTREFDVTAVTAEAALENGMLVLNGRDPNNLLFAKDALLFVRTSDLAGGKLKPGVPVEPLILRAAAGEWIKVTVRNGFNLNNAVFQSTYSNQLPYGTPFTATPGASPTPANNTPLPSVPFKTSSNVGLHPQLVAYNPVNANGLIVGFNPSDKLVAPGTSQDFYWYAGKVTTDETGKNIVKTTPIEFGGTNLVAADQLIQPQFGMVGALVVEPEGSSWAEDISTRAAATVTKRDGTQFREFVVVDQNMFANSALPANLNNLNQANSQGNGGGTVVGAINFRSEPFLFRSSANGAQNLPQPPPKGYSQVFSNTLFAKNPTDPVTPVFIAPAGMAARFRLVVPSTSTNNTAIIGPPVFIVHGHNWQEEPYTDDSTKIGNNRLSEHLGAIEAGPNQKFDLLFDSAGGSDRVPGDYLYDTYQTGGTLGTWGVFRVTKEEVVIDKVQLAGDALTASGSVRFVTANGHDPLPKELKISAADPSNARIDLGQADVDTEGKWSFQTAKPGLNKPFTIQAMAVTGDGTAGATAVTEIEP